MIDEGHLDIRPTEDHDDHRLRIVPTYAPAAFTWPAPWTC
jgi:hypothetical protein